MRPRLGEEIRGRSVRIDISRVVSWLECGMEANTGGVRGRNSNMHRPTPIPLP